jgi:hypothetical protein
MDNKKQDSKKGNSGRESGRESSEKGNQARPTDSLLVANAVCRM